jgi:hypothetical protein
MKSSNKLAGTSFSRASASQAIHVQSSADIGRARWDSIHGSKLEVWDLLSKGTSSMSTTIDEDKGELKEVSKGEEWWQDTRSQTISLVARTTSTCESVTGEGSGFRGANGSGGKPGVRVQDSTNLGETCEDPAPRKGGKAERGESKGGGKAEAGGCRAARFHLSTIAAFQILGSEGGRGG